MLCKAIPKLRRAHDPPNSAFVPVTRLLDIPKSPDSVLQELGDATHGYIV